MGSSDGVGQPASRFARRLRQLPSKFLRFQFGTPAITSSLSVGGDGGSLAITATTGDIVVGADIETSTGSSGADAPAGQGGSVTLTANTGAVTVNNRVQVSHNTVNRRSASGGTDRTQEREDLRRCNQC
jgi:hypothetical protein